MRCIVVAALVLCVSPVWAADWTLDPDGVWRCSGLDGCGFDPERLAGNNAIVDVYSFNDDPDAFSWIDSHLQQGHEVRMWLSTVAASVVSGLGPAVTDIRYDDFDPNDGGQWRAELVTNRGEGTLWISNFADPSESLFEFYFPTDPPYEPERWLFVSLLATRPIPEPSTMTLAVVVLLSAFWMRRSTS